MRIVRPRVAGLGLIACLVLIALGAERAPVRDDASALSADAYLAHVKYLASDDLEGRRPGTPGIEKAAEYIAGQFKAADLKPAGDDGTWFQSFDVKRGKTIVDEEALLHVEGIEQDWRVREDWVPLPFSSSEQVEGPLAFAGYGIEAPEHNYNDYADFDAEGKILLVFRYEPQADDPEAPFGGKEVSRYSLFTRKARTAARHGARGLLIVNPPKRDGITDELYPFVEEYALRTFEIPVVHVTWPVAEAIVRKAGLSDLAALQEKLDAGPTPASTDLDLKLVLHPGLAPNLVETRNVIGLLPGTGRADETIVIGAHYDHLGNVSSRFGGESAGPVIHNGADDNASGTAGVIELARVLAAEGGFRRNLLFIAFSAEEMGLLGSKHFVDHATVDLESIRAIVNLDMIGRLSQDKFTIFGITSGEEFEPLIRRPAERLGLSYRSPKGFAGNSDHAVFYYYDIPYLFFFTGVHKEYHRPTDDWELIDAAGATRVLRLAQAVIQELADMERGPTFCKQTTRAGPEDLEMKPAVEHERDAQKAEEQGRGGHGTGGEVEKASRPRVRLGIIPDFTGDDRPGMVTDMVLDGGAAQAAGLKAGDRIIRIAEIKITDVYAYMDALRSHKPGDEIDLVVVREGKELTLKVKLQGPRRRDGEN